MAGAAERFSYYAVTAPWQNYMAIHRNDKALPGALGLGQSKATAIYNAYFFFSYLTPLPFAIVSDLYLGRAKTLLISLGFYFAGCVVLFATSLPVALDRGAGLPGLAVAMVLIGLGVGGVKATFSPYLGDQYAEKGENVVERKGQRVRANRTMTLQLIFNIFYWFTNLGALSSVASTFLEKKVDFWAAYLLAVVSLAISIVMFVGWQKQLVNVEPQGSTFLKTVKLLPSVTKGKFGDSGSLRAHGVTASSQDGSSSGTPDTVILEIRRGLLACRVIFSFVIFYLCFNQIYNNLISQAGQMRLDGVPNDLIQVLNGVACILLGPLIQASYSYLSRYQIRVGPILRITWSFVFMGAGMAYSAGLQQLIYNTGPCFDFPLKCATSDGGRIPNNISVWVQTPVYFLLAVAEILGFVSASEYAYSKSPRDMRTVVQALTQFTAAIGSGLGMALSPVSKDPYLMIMYACLAAAAVVSAALFWWKFGKFDAIDEELNNLELEKEGPRRDTAAGNRSDGG
ncbi:hypothetical protein P154DRAFT_526318 [Amniculicola lignicola CBS 123094]|uniref:Uncharacterized protein n=1 Tax=Amniculicola lignicola CBS 123094 TaxID=1392246 RepID=A0A6A5W2W2_9PLEO|nr:hypothetical protein P154DRAFT_526318 [Amniculicola lignicola CBS 123094]